MTGLDRRDFGLVIHSYWIRRERPLLPDFSSVSDPVAFLRLAADLGLAGVQTAIGNLTPVQTLELQRLQDATGCYIEGIVRLPTTESDIERFEHEMICSQKAGATIVRSVCLSGRRYEIFKSREDWKEFLNQSWKSLQWAESIAAKLGMVLAIENHKDFRVDEMLDWLNRLSSAHVGVCLDTGNNVALLEEPNAVINELGPWTKSTHLKDVGVQRCDEGFLLNEVPFGAGCVDVRQALELLRDKAPAARWNIEMITRPPLVVPCNLNEYWVTFDREADTERFARFQTWLAEHEWKGTFSLMESLDHRQQLELEQANIDRCLQYE